MPVWHEKTKQLREEGALELVSIVPEQHGERTRLFMQWKELDWTTLVDPLNLLGLPYVPVALAIDEHGVVRLVQPMFGPLAKLEEFVATEYEAPETPPEAPVAAPPSGRPGDDAGAGAWRAHGDRLALEGGPKALAAAIEAYERAVALDPEDAVAWFRLGVVHRLRYDSDARRADDFQRAVRAWSRSLALDPNDYIVRRRLQQYGPRTGKPYPFYDWVPEARSEIAARGETPIPLAVEPAGSELAGRLASLPDAAGDEPPDPEGKIRRDDRPYVSIEPTVVPWPPEPGEPLRVHLVFRPNDEVDAHWNNEVGPLAVWLDPPEGWAIGARRAEVPLAAKATSTEVRRVEAELRAPDGGAEGAASLRGYALYYVCEGEKGRCLYRRQDLEIPLTRAAGS